MMTIHTSDAEKLQQLRDFVEVDMCSQCFETKLVPWLREQGAEPRTTEWG